MVIIRVRSAVKVHSFGKRDYICNMKELFDSMALQTAENLK